MKLKAAGFSIDGDELLKVSRYLMVTVSPGRALIFQLQLSRDGYWKGQPGLVITPLGALRSSEPSLHAGEEDTWVSQTETDRYLLVSSSAASSPVEIPDT